MANLDRMRRSELIQEVLSERRRTLAKTRRRDELRAQLLITNRQLTTAKRDLEHDQSKLTIGDCVVQQKSEEILDLKRKLDRIKEQSTCSICLGEWGTHGAHRMVSLQCGHLFGDDCIRRYLEGYFDCPLCMQAADVMDLRYIYGYDVQDL